MNEIRTRTIGERLRDMREDNDKTQAEIAELLKCSQVCYSYYELGKRAIPAEYLIILATYYNTSVDYLLGLTPGKQPYPKEKV
ncbi:MAG: helix-turn-helix domain-containing protein [Huintestinicola sp.]